MKHSIAAFAALMLIAPSFALAHEHQNFIIGGKTYEFVVGSLNEPITVDDKTGVDLRVTTGGVPVEGLEKTLKVELQAGDKKKPFELTTVYGTKGAYKAIFFPTVETTYTYRVYGTINDTPVDLSFTCNPAGHVAEPEDKTEIAVSEGVTRILKSGQFGCPTAKEALGFPEPSASIVNIHADMHEHNSAALSAAGGAKSQAGVGIALGLLGVILGSVAVVRTKK